MDSPINSKKIIITYGTFDMFHRGHLRLLERAKALGDYLIVGVTDENYDRSRGKLNVIESTQKRVEAVDARKKQELVPRFRDRRGARTAVQLLWRPL